MILRTLLLAVALVCTAPTHNAQAQQGPAPSAVELAAARDAVQLLLIDSGAVPFAIQQAFATHGQTIRQQLTSAPFYLALSQPRKDAVLAALDQFPNILRIELDAALPVVLETAALEFAAPFTEAEMVAIQTYMRSDVAENGIKRSVLNGVQDGVQPGSAPPLVMTPEEQAAEAAFMATPAGVAFAQHQSVVNSSLGNAIQNGFASVTPGVQRRFTRLLCDAMAEECPAQMRGI